MASPQTIPEQWYTDATDQIQELKARVRELEERLERDDQRILDLAVLFGVPDGGRYWNDWKERAAALVPANKETAE